MYTKCLYDLLVLLAVLNGAIICTAASIGILLTVCLANAWMVSVCDSQKHENLLLLYWFEQLHTNVALKVQNLIHYPHAHSIIGYSFIPFRSVLP